MTVRKALLVLLAFALVCSFACGASAQTDPESELYGGEGGEGGGPDEAEEPKERVTIGVLRRGTPEACSTDRVSEGSTARVQLTLSKVDSAAAGGRTVVLDKEKVIHVGHGHFLEGVESGLVGACKGEKRSLRIPASLAFGVQGSKKLGVAPNTDLRAVVEVLETVEPDPYGDDNHHHHEDEDMDEAPMEDGEGAEDGDGDATPPIPAELFHSHVPKLTGAAVEALQATKNVLVMFYAPWCGHCTSLKPVYAKLAVAFAGEAATVEVVAVDADEDKEGAEPFGVEGFPTIVLLKKGQTVSQGIKYEGGRSLSAFVQYLNGELGTERLGNGRLSDQAGTNAELNQVVLEWKGKTRTMAALSAAVPQGSYYRRVIEGIETHGEGYIAKEKGRLEKIYQDGKAPVKPEQLDSIQRRLNILDVFADD